MTNVFAKISSVRYLLLSVHVLDVVDVVDCVIISCNGRWITEPSRAQCGRPAL